MRARLATLVLVVASLAVVAAGCGGSDDEADPTAAWASGFCTAVTTWTDSIQEITTQFTDDASNLSQDGFEEAASDVRTSTQQLVDDLQALGAPDTESGEEIRSSLDTLSTTLESEAAEIESTVEGISGLTGIPSALSTVTASLSAMGSAFSAALQAIDEADVDGELQAALEDSPECADITE